MLDLQFLLLCAGTVSAQLTTSLLMPVGNYDTDKIGFLGSVIDANNTHATIALQYDNGTDWEALKIPQTATPATVTIGPNLYEASQDATYLAAGLPTKGGDYIYSVSCDMPHESSANASCSASYGALIGSTIQCEIGGSTTFTDYNTIIHTYPPRGSVSGGVATSTRTMFFPAPNENRPDWCDDESYSPTEGYTTEYQVEPTYLMRYQVVVTAGGEKLSAMSQASATPGTATSTLPPMLTGSPVMSSAASTVTGAAAHLVTGRRVMFGIGAVAMMMM